MVSFITTIESGDERRCKFSNSTHFIADAHEHIRRKEKLNGGIWRNEVTPMLVIKSVFCRTGLVKTMLIEIETYVPIINISIRVQSLQARARKLTEHMELARI